MLGLTPCSSVTSKGCKPRDVDTHSPLLGFFGSGSGQGASTFTSAWTFCEDFILSSLCILQVASASSCSSCCGNSKSWRTEILWLVSLLWVPSVFVSNVSSLVLPSKHPATLENCCCSASLASAGLPSTKFVSSILASSTILFSSVFVLQLRPRVWELLDVILDALLGPLLLPDFFWLVLLFGVSQLSFPNRQGVTASTTSKELCVGVLSKRSSSTLKGRDVLSWDNSPSISLLLIFVSSDKISSWELPLEELVNCFWFGTEYELLQAFCSFWITLMPRWLDACSSTSHGGLCISQQVTRAISVGADGKHSWRPAIDTWLDPPLCASSIRVVFSSLGTPFSSEPSTGRGIEKSCCIGLEISQFVNSASWQAFSLSLGSSFTCISGPQIGFIWGLCSVVAAFSKPSSMKVSFSILFCGPHSLVFPAVEPSVASSTAWSTWPSIGLITEGIDSSEEETLAGTISFEGTVVPLEHRWLPRPNAPSWPYPCTYGIFDPFTSTSLSSLYSLESALLPCELSAFTVSGESWWRTGPSDFFNFFLAFPSLVYSIRVDIDAASADLFLVVVFNWTDFKLGESESWLDCSDISDGRLLCLCLTRSYKSDSVVSGKNAPRWPHPSFLGEIASLPILINSGCIVAVSTAFGDAFKGLLKEGSSNKEAKPSKSKLWVSWSLTLLATISEGNFLFTVWDGCW